MDNNKNQEILQDAIMNALDDVELEGVAGGISKRTVAEIAGAVVGAGLIFGAYKLGGHSKAGELEEANQEIKSLISKNSDLRFENQCSELSLLDAGEIIAKQEKDIYIKDKLIESQNIQIEKLQGQIQNPSGQ